MKRFYAFAVVALLASASARTPFVLRQEAEELPIVSSPGDRAIIPGWHLRNTKDSDINGSAASVPGVDVSEWYRMGPRGTVMAGLIESGFYDDSSLFFSDNLNTEVDYSLFGSPWLYREEFMLEPDSDQHYFIETNGISSRGDIYFNGELLVSNSEQDGSYVGHKYEVTDRVQSGLNCVVIQAYPTNYLRDLAMGFIDWNPYPPDNGTGVWRNVEVSQTGQIAITSPMRVITDFMDPNASSVNVTVRLDVQNVGDKAAEGGIEGQIQTDDQSQSIPLSKSIELEGKEKATVSVEAVIENPRVWWPASWGEQPLYNVSLEVQTGSNVSDVAVETTFGIRHVESQLNSQEDIEFTVNGNPFLVMGAGYTSDMFLRLDMDKLKVQFQYMLDMGLNTVRLEGKQEHPELYDLADRMGLMVMAGWECCDKWEGWSYNDEGSGEVWEDKDYTVGNYSMLHEAGMMQSHPSMLGFLVGSDFWPDDRATKIYVDALNRMDWDTPIVASASKRGFPEQLGPSGMKMNGPYDWVPPNYWYGDQLGAAFGFGSELGAGCGTPGLRSMKKFLSSEDMEDLWAEPDKNLFHMSRDPSKFTNRSVYNDALYARYGEPTDLDDYLLKARLMDFEAARAEFESYSARQSADAPSTGLIYWMLNGAWPNLHWSLFDYYMNPIATYFGTKVGTRTEHVAYDYQEQAIYIINHSLDKEGSRTIRIDLIDTSGQSLSQDEVQTETTPNSSKQVTTVSGIDEIPSVGFLRLVLEDEAGEVLSRNVYWLSQTVDVLAWDDSNWYYTPVSEYANFADGLAELSTATVSATVDVNSQVEGQDLEALVTLENGLDAPAFFIQLTVVQSTADEEVAPVYWSENYVTLWPEESLELSVKFPVDWCEDTVIEISGYNVDSATIDVC